MRYGVISVFAFVGIVAVATASADDQEVVLPSSKTSQAPILEYYSGIRPGSRMYWVRNTAGTPKTEIDWRDDKVVLAGGRIMKCPKGGCEWAAFTTTDDKPAKKTTTFGWGVNGDQFKDRPEAYCHNNDKVDTESKKGTLLRTMIHGTFADKDDREVQIDISVSSEVVAGDIIYVFQSRTPLMLSASDEKKVEGTLDKPLVIWESAESNSFKEAVGFKNVELGKTESKFTIRNPKGIQVSRKLLKIMIGDDVIAKTTAAAYTPKD
jgi:hypothetical protein